MAVGIQIRLCPFHREFFSAENISCLNELGINYLMPCRNTHGVVGSLRRFAADRRRDTLPCTLAGSGTAAPYNMVIVERRRRDPKKAPTAPENRYIGFATNMPWVDVIVYAVRWGIESGYARVEAMRAKTRSRRPGARLFCFVYSLMAFNMWVMARALLSAPGLPLARRKGTVTQLAFKEILRALADGTGPGPPSSLFRSWTVVSCSISPTGRGRGRHPAGHSAGAAPGCMDGAGDAAHARMGCTTVRLRPYAARAMPDRMPRTAGRRGRCGGFDMPCRHGRACVQHKSVRKEGRYASVLDSHRSDFAWLIYRVKTAPPRRRPAARLHASPTA